MEDVGVLEQIVTLTAHVVVLLLHELVQERLDRLALSRRWAARAHALHGIHIYTGGRYLRNVSSEVKWPLQLSAAARPDLERMLQRWKSRRRLLEWRESKKSECICDHAHVIGFAYSDSVCTLQPAAAAAGLGR